MERLPAESKSVFVGWEEVKVSSDRGRREVHYYLKRRDGTSDLAVVGKEKSLRHMSYHFAIRDRSLRSISLSSSVLKLRSRREVIDWLNSIVPDSHLHQASLPSGGPFRSKDASVLDVQTLKNIQLRKLGQCTAEFKWLGSPWTCRKRRRHYQLFCRNGVKISVHDFVYVLAEEDKRLVAYLDDMYEDFRGNKMVVVRWFHKIDEVGIVLPHNFNDREIFFSLCLQDLSIECIDGLATILSPQHYEKFLNEASHMQLEPFVCHRQFDNDDVKPFDMTLVKGYWKQEILRYMSIASSSKSQPSDNGLKVQENPNDATGVRPWKRLRQSKDTDTHLQSAYNEDAIEMGLDGRDFCDSLSGSRGRMEMCSLKEGCPAASLSAGEAVPPKHLTIGSEVEVLSQDSGLRGCWFRALIIKKHKYRVKVRYQDIKDAEDEANNLEEWVFASRVAVLDELSVRICGRTTVRPTPLSNKGMGSCPVNVGSLVDVWWHDGWWEAIVIRKESEERVHVYFPGEKRESIFSQSDLRHSEDWWANGWNHLKERPELVASILAGLGTKLSLIKSCNGKPDQVGAIYDDTQRVGVVQEHSLSEEDEVKCGDFCVDSREDKVKDLEQVVRDLSKDDLLVQLRWKSSRKKRSARNLAQKLHTSVTKNKSRQKVLGKAGPCERFYIGSSLKVDHDNCKYIGDSLFSSSVVSPLTSLVMSR